ncbi:MAG TPA: CBS domain-containing protein [Desulfobacteria bacterium]|nr:CBS domain-containing protein [Desulfobacteria bacterium]
MVEIPAKIKKIVDGHGWLRNLTVSNIMETDVITINEDATLQEFDSLINRYKHQGYPVVDKASKTVGVISLKDLLRVDEENWDTCRVKDRMSTCLICARPEESIIDAVEKMTRAGVGRLLVMDGDRLVGIISRSCIMDKVIKRMVT